MRNIFLILWLSIFLTGNLAAQKTQQSKAPVAVTAKKEFKVELTFSTKGGLYNEVIDLELFSPGAKIYYTTDGSYPTSKAIRYRKPLTIKKTTPIRAVAYRGKHKSDIKGHTYLINEPKTTFPIVSIQITPDILFDPETGLYMEGAGAKDSIWSKPSANFWSKREKKISTEIFESNGECIFRDETGFRLFGGMSRLFPQKSMTLVARDDYGKKRFRHKLFGDEGLKKFKFLVLRNSGSDFGKSHFRDGFMTTLVEDWDLEKQDYRPAHVYLNGKYWGIYNIREKINRYFLEDHCDIDKDSIDLMEHRRNRKRGSRLHYFEMLDYIEKHDLSDPAHYAYINSQMDIQNFMDYEIAQIYFDNRDAGGNIKYWRPQTPNGRWRWILYDTDWGFGLHDRKAYAKNSLKFHLEEDGPAWPNPPWSTFILRNMMKNDEFRTQFVNRFADYLNTTFDPENVLALIDKMEGHIEPEIDRQLDRWNLEKDDWEAEVETMRKFGIKRPKYMRKFLKAMFEVGEEVDIQFAVKGGGHILINDNIKVTNKALHATYFEELAINVKAVPNFGFRFSHWQGVDFEDKEFTLDLTQEELYKIKAVFVPYNNPLAGKVIINEVNCNYKKSGDWVEIYNNSEEVVHLDNWVLTDNNNQFKIPKVTLQPKTYITVCENLKKFQNVYPNQYRIVGDMGFGLSKFRENIQLFSDKGETVDSIGYNLEPRDSAFTLNLLLPKLDNSDIENWNIKTGYGTPNSANPYYLESSVRVEQEQWIRLGSFIGIALVLMFLIVMKKAFA